MNRIFLNLVIVMLVLSCSGDDEYETRELNLTLKTTNAESSYNASPVMFPNPFKEYLYIAFNRETSAEILINDSHGNFKKFTVTDTRELMIDFSREKPGAYCCEIVENNKVFRTYLIKE